MPEHQGLHFRWPYFVAGRVDHAFEPVGNEKIAVVVDPAQVTGAEKALSFKINERCRCCLGLLPVAQKILRSAYDDFSRFAYRHFTQRIGVDHARIGAHVGDTKALLLGRIGRVEMRRRGGFGQTITFGITQAVVVEQTLCDCLWHGRPTAANLHQGRQIVFRQARTGQEINHHGRNVSPVGHPPGRYQPARKVAIPARHDDHGRPGINAAMHHADHSSRMEHRHHRQRDVLCRPGAD